MEKLPPFSGSSGSRNSDTPPVTPSQNAQSGDKYNEPFRGTRSSGTGEVFSEREQAEGVGCGPTARLARWKLAGARWHNCARAPADSGLSRRCRAWSRAFGCSDGRRARATLNRPATVTTSCVCITSRRKLATPARCSGGPNRRRPGISRTRSAASSAASRVRRPRPAMP